MLGRWGGGGEGEEVGRKRASLEKGGESVELGVEVKSSSFRGGESLTAVPTSRRARAASGPSRGPRDRICCDRGEDGVEGRGVVQALRLIL